MAESTRTRKRPSSRADEIKAAAHKAGEELPPERKPSAAPPRSRQKKLEEFIASFSLPFAMAGDSHCAMVIAHNAEPVADAWIRLANESSPVSRVIDRILEGGAWGGVIMATLGMVIPILDHHDMWPLPNPYTMFTVAEDSNGDIPGDMTPEDIERAMRMAADMADNTDTGTTAGTPTPGEKGDKPSK